MAPAHAPHGETEFTLGVAFGQSIAYRSFGFDDHGVGHEHTDGDHGKCAPDQNSVLVQRGEVAAKEADNHHQE